MLNTFRERNDCDQEAKFVQDRIVSVERSIAELCDVFSQYNRKAARLRDKGDELAKFTQRYSQIENINQSLGLGLENFSNSISLLSSYGNLRVESIEKQVLSGLIRYEDICKRAKDDVKQLYNAREKEINRKRQLNRIRERNPRNRQQIIQAETELVKATAEFSKTLHNLEKRSAEFEKQKLHDIKSILLDFVSIELGYHAKALEVLTNAFNHIENINEESDLQEFQKSFCMSKNRNSKGIFRSANSFGSLGAMLQNVSSKQQGIPRGASRSAETLDSIKKSISDSDEETMTDTDDPTEHKTESDKN